MKLAYAAIPNVKRCFLSGLIGSFAFVLAACDHLPLYNKEKDELAKSAQQTYLGAKVTEVYAVQEQNLQKLLQAEVDALNESAALRLDIALLQMSDDRPVADSSTSMAAWYQQARKNEDALGFPDSAAVLAMLDYQVDVAGAQADIEDTRNQIGAGGDVRALRTLPSCEDVKGKPATAETWPFLAKNPGNGLTALFEEYVKRCNIVTQTPPGAGGRVAQAFNDLTQAETELAARRGEAADLAEKVSTAAAKVKAAEAEAGQAQAAVAEATDKVKQNVDAAKKAADGLLDAVKTLREQSGGEGAALAAEQNIKNISVVLGALGSGNVDAASDQTSDLAKAAKALGTGAPALAKDMAALIDHARAPPVANLILELQHQTIELNYAKALIRLSELRIGLLRARYNKLVDEAGAWRSFRLSLCNYAVLSSGGNHPGAACDTFEAKPVSREVTTEVRENAAECTLNNAPLPDCVLNRTWRQAKDAGGASRVQREFWSALYYYAEAVEAERAAREAEFRLVDIDHREVLAAERSGIEAWSNLVEVPIGQLAAYHASGIQPEALAQAISLLLGLTSIGAGVAQ